MTDDELAAKTEEIKKFIGEEFKKEVEKNHLKESEFIKLISSDEWLEKKMKEFRTKYQGKI